MSDLPITVDGVQFSHRRYFVNGGKTHRTQVGSVHTWVGIKPVLDEAGQELVANFGTEEAAIIYATGKLPGKVAEFLPELVAAPEPEEEHHDTGLRKRVQEKYEGWRDYGAVTG